MRVRERAAKFRDVPERGAARNERQRDGGDGDAEDAERQLHQPKRNVEPASSAHRPDEEANPLFTATFTCTALAAIVAGPISDENRCARRDRAN